MKFVKYYLPHLKPNQITYDYVCLLVQLLAASRQQQPQQPKQNILRAASHCSTQLEKKSEMIKKYLDLLKIVINPIPNLKHQKTSTKTLNNLEITRVIRNL